MALSAAETNRYRFAQTYNQILGDKLGRHLPYRTDREIHQGISQEVKDNIAIMLAKKIKEIDSSSNSTRTLDENTPTNAAALLGLTGKKTTKVKVPKLNLEKKSGSGGDIGVWGGIKNLVGTIDEAVTNNPVTDALQDNPVTRFGASALSKTLEGLARGSYGANEGLRNTFESVNAGEPVWSLGDDFFTGVWEGASGEKKTGFGAVRKEATRSPEFENRHWTTKQLFGRGQDIQYVDGKLVDQNDEAYQNTARARGTDWDTKLTNVGGEFLTDPLTYFTAGTVKAAVGATGKGIRKGSEFIGKEAITKEVSNAIQRVFDDVGEDILRGKSKVTSIIPGKVTRVPYHQLIQDEVIANTLDNIVYDSVKGTVTGGTKRDMHRTIAQATAEKVRDKYFDLVKPIRAKFLLAWSAGKKYTPTELKALRAKSPLMHQWMDSVDEAMAEFSAAGRKIDPTAIGGRADEIFVETKMAPIIGQIKAKMITELDNTIMRVPRVTFMNNSAYLPRMGRALNKAKLASGNRFENLNKVFRYASWFPEFTTNLAQKARSMSSKRFREFKNEIEVAMEGTSKEDRILIHTAIQERRTLTGHLAAPQKYIIDKYAEIFAEEVGKFRNPLTTKQANNYVFNYVKKGANNIDFEKDWKLPKRRAVGRSRSIDGWTSVDAKKLGLKVEEDAAQALLLRQGKMLRDLSRVEFHTDLITHFGIRSHIALKDYKQQGLVLINKTEFPDLYKGLQKTEHLYLDEQINQIYKNYNTLSKISPTAASNDVVRTFLKLTRIFKSANTIYWPGFHIRNMISDVFMGALDGVKSSAYGKIFKAMVRREKSFLPVGGESVKFTEIYDSYYNKLSTGFFDSDLNIAVDRASLSSTRFMDVVASPKIIGTKLREASTVREDFGRLVHYYHALDEEMTFQLKKGLSRKKAWENAEIAAQGRVNKFKFDYNALTPDEQKIRKYGIPFYTYMRKATPVLVENLMMNPKYFSYIERLQNALAPTEDFIGAKQPAWMTEMSNSLLTGGDEPIGFTDNLFPTRTLKDTFNLTDLPAKVNPIYGGAVELSVGKDLFTGREIKGDLGDRFVDVLKNKFRGVGQYRAIESDTKPTMEKWFGFFGIPIVQVTKARQEGREDQLLNMLGDKVEALNNKLENAGLRISVRSNKIYLIRPKSPTTKEIRREKDPKYPVNDKEDIIDIYNTFDELPI